MGRETKIDLGSFTIASYLDERFVLAVSTSVTLRLPEQYASTVRTAIDLRDHIKQGNLWAARASACKIDLYLGFEAYAGSREGMQDTLLAAFEDCPVWQTLGLQLRRGLTPATIGLGGLIPDTIEPGGITPDTIKSRGLTPDIIEPASGTLHTYHLQHVSEHSTLITPEDVPCVYISTWHCEFSFGCKKTHTDIIGTETATPNILSKIVTLKLPSRKLRRFSARRRPWEPVTIERQKRQPDSEHKTAPTQALLDHNRVAEEPEFFSFPKHLQNERLEHLTFVALSSILGLRRRFADIQVEPPQTISLLDIAPTIYNPLYLQGLITRMQSASLISSALSNLASTQSPILRQKVLNLQQHQNPQPYTILDTVKRPITSLILRSTAIPKVNTYAKKTAVHNNYNTSIGLHLSDDDISPYLSTGILAKDLQQEPSDSEDIFEDDHNRDMYTHTMDHYRPDDSRLVAEQDWAGCLLPESVSDELCDTQELQGGYCYCYDLNDVAITFDDYDLNSDPSDERGTDSTIFNQDVMYPLSYDPATLGGEGNVWGNEVDNDIETVEEDFEIPSHSDINGETTCTPDFEYRIDNTCAPARGWILDDDLQTSQNWHMMYSAGPDTVPELGI